MEFKDAWLMYCDIARGIQLIYVIDITQETVTEFWLLLIGFIYIHIYLFIYLLTAYSSMIQPPQI
jgi:hypothetical protein